MTRFWGKLFLINFALGVVTGITMEFQFGMNWSEYSRFVGDIFGAPLAIEATVAFFLESVFIGVWIFGWDKVSKKVHALSIWIVAFATNLSALWILLANGWMQHPVGYELRNGRAEMVDFGALLTNPAGWYKFSHTVFSGYAVTASSSWGSAPGTCCAGAKPTSPPLPRAAAVFGLASCLLVFATGDFSAVEVARTQPAKFAAMESIWETQRGVGINLLLLPDTMAECNAMEEVCIPKALSLLAFHDPTAEVRGLKDFPADERPPVLPTFLSFRAMAGLGIYMTLAALLATIFAFRRELEQRTWLLRLLLWSIPAPYLAGQLGWIVAEVGRQPWIVYGVLKTAGPSLAISVGRVVASLVGFTLLWRPRVVDIYLLPGTPQGAGGRPGPGAGRLYHRSACRIRTHRTGGVNELANHLVRSLGRPLGRLLHARRLRPRRRHAA
jgi:cytochrome d ubiquinol oxidase subunit I